MSHHTENVQRNSFTVSLQWRGSLLLCNGEVVCYSIFDDNDNVAGERRRGNGEAMRNGHGAAVLPADQPQLGMTRSDKLYDFIFYILK
jgi:hypothetical protein